jgi:hypothetical protein
MIRRAVEGFRQPDDFQQLPLRNHPPLGRARAEGEGQMMTSVSDTMLSVTELLTAAGLELSGGPVDWEVQIPERGSGVYIVTIDPLSLFPSLHCRKLCGIRKSST